VVPPSSHRVSRVRRYSGYSPLYSPFAYVTFTLFRRPFHAVLLEFVQILAVRTPKALLPSVWPLPLSLATTYGISVDFFSSPYLDVSVQAVPPVQLWIHCTVTGHDSSRIAPFGNLWITACLRLPIAYRSLPRPSSAPSAKASPLRSL
jgi:hypothetical protein